MQVTKYDLVCFCSMQLNSRKEKKQIYKMRMIKSLVQSQYTWYMLQHIYVPSQSAITVRKKHKEKKQFHQLENQKTVVAYGDANFLSIKGHSPAPVKKTLQAIAQKALAILINEYKTSITCSTCHNPLDNVYSFEDFKCEHTFIQGRFMV
ncbi:hypothetical protein K501DRAFT_275673 [Backusella circina FSU 941]|nr:hypothetical protein K501DRAFT_275673 [Backusella circina FSU 941]